MVRIEVRAWDSVLVAAVLGSDYRPVVVLCPYLLLSLTQTLQSTLSASTDARSEVKSAVVSQLASLEEQVTVTQAMVRALETQVPTISDLRGFATKVELAQKADIDDVNEVQH